MIIRNNIITRFFKPYLPNVAIAIIFLSTIILIISCNRNDKVYKNNIDDNQNQNYTKLDSIILDRMKLYNIPASAVGIIKNGEIEFTNQYGYQSNGVPVNDSTLFSIASMTKIVTVEIILKIVEDGIIGLDDNLSDYYIDENIIDDDRHKLLTPRIMLSHRSGFVNWRGQKGENGKLSFKFDPDTDWLYSGEGLDYLGKYIETRTGKSFEAFADDYVFKPLQLNNTTYSYRKWIEGRVVSPYYSDGKEGDKEEYIREKGNWSGGNLMLTTIDDFTVFLEAIINNEILSKEIISLRDSIQSSSFLYPTIEEKIGAKSNIVNEITNKFGFGLVWTIHEFKDQKILQHGGSGWGIQAMCFYSKKTKDGMVIITNKGDGYYLIRDIIDEVFPNSPFNVYYSELVKRIDRGS